MKIWPPKIADRDHQGVLDNLKNRVPGYAPEWSFREGTACAALMRIFARYAEIFIKGLDQVPERSFIAFLDMLGTSLLPAQSARVPLVFTLMEQSPVSVKLPEKSQVAAPTQTEPPSQLSTEPEASNDSREIVFATTQTITLTRAKLAAVYSIQPESDAYADYTADITRGFTLFDEQQPITHTLYLGHDALYALAGDAEVELSLDMAASDPRSTVRDVLVEWEYLSQDGWLPLVVEKDTTARFTRDGRIRLKKDCGPDAKREIIPASEDQQKTITGHESYWIRCGISDKPPSGTIVNDGTNTEINRARIPVDTAWQFVSDDMVTINGEERARVETIQDQVLILDRELSDATPGRRIFMADRLPPLRQSGADTAGFLPEIDVIRTRVGFTKVGLQPDGAFTDTAPVDLANNFYPFGQQPTLYTTFYLASEEAFQRRRARVSLQVELSEPGFVPEGTQLRLDWEYYNGTDWRQLNDGQFRFQDETDRFTVNGQTPPLSISFLAPLDWRETTVNGEQNYWLRVRIGEGDYGHPLRLEPIPSGPVPEDFTIEANPSTLRPPVISKLTLQYTYQTEPTLLDHCLTENSFVYTDHSEDCRWQRRTFEPFQPVDDAQPASYFGFSQALSERDQPSGLISLYLHMPPEANEGNSHFGSSAVVWEYFGERGWTDLSVLDDTLGFRQSGMIQYLSPKDAISTPGLGGMLFRIRARLKQGEPILRAPIAGVWLNAVWATQRSVVEREVLGTSDGNPGQTFSLLRRQRQPVLEGEEVEIREWTGRGDDWETALAGVSEQDRRLERDPVTREVVAAWVRWHEQPHLYNSGDSDRHYVLERSSGLMRFGDGRRGFIPPAGSRIVASYNSGGGLAGNIAKDGISELRTGVPYLEGAKNPIAATGGTASESPVSTLARGPQRIRHRDRALTATDFEWLAREASPGVARAQCLPITGPVGRGQRGWVTLMIIPHSQDALPLPTPELKRRVREYLSERVPATLVGRIRIEDPRYVPVNVTAEIVPKQPDKATEVELRVREELKQFLHPLSGGEDRRGWSFGEPVYLSQIARIIESAPGVDYASHIGLRVDGQMFDEYVPVEGHALIAPGDHELKLTFNGRRGR